MNTYKVEFDIDSYIYSQKMIEAFEFERNKHVLHEIIYLGAEVVDGNKTLSYSDINFLTQSEAARLNLETKVKLGTDKLLELYKDDIKKTNTMWKNIIAQSKKKIVIINLV